MQQVTIAGRRIGAGQPIFIIAEAGVNHNGDLDLARRLIDAAVEAGADAVKFQTFTADKLVTPDAVKAAYQQETTGAGESQYAMLKRLELAADAHHALKVHCEQRGILFMSSPFDEDSADLLERLGVPAFKLGSGELTNLPLLEHIGRKGLPVLISTGMAYLSEVEAAVRTLRDVGNQQMVVLHCVSNYPAQPADTNLRAMHTMQAALGVIVGYSDHTLGIEISLAAAALGAAVIEKHFTLDKTMPGPDHRASAEPDELAALVRGVRNIEQAIGHGYKVPAASEADTASVARKSIVAGVDIPAGAVIGREMLALKRPGTGLPAAILPYVVGRRARQFIPAGTLITLEALS